MEAITLDKKIEMVFIYGESGRSIDNAVALYAQRFPDQKRSRASFYRVIQQFSTEGSVKPKKRNRQNMVACENNEIAVLAAVAHDPHISTRQISRESGISQTTVCKILHRNKYHPFHVSLHQELAGDDFQKRVTFCQWARQQIERDPNFFAKVLFSDESTFTNHGTVNRHNMHYWSTENPHWLQQVEHQYPWNVNVWCGIIGDKLIGPYFIEGNLNGEKYANFLRNQFPVLLEDLTLELRQTMWFQHDGCPAHYSLVAREILNNVYNQRWIGRGGPVKWPARSPDLTSPDFCLWGYLKNEVYKKKPTTREDMMRRITTACQKITPDMLLSCVSSFEMRINKCIEVNGHIFEHLLK